MNRASRSTVRQLPPNRLQYRERLKQVFSSFSFLFSVLLVVHLLRKYLLQHQLQFVELFNPKLFLIKPNLTNDLNCSIVLIQDQLELHPKPKEHRAVALSFSTPWDQWDQVSLLDLLVSNPQALQRTLASVNLETAVEEASTVIEEVICNSTMDSRIDDFFAIDFDCNMEAATFNHNPDEEVHSCINLEVGYVSHSLDYNVDVVDSYCVVAAGSQEASLSTRGIDCNGRMNCLLEVVDLLHTTIGDHNHCLHARVTYSFISGLNLAAHGTIVTVLEDHNCFDCTHDHIRSLIHLFNFNQI